MIKEFTMKAIKTNGTVKFGTGVIGRNRTLILSCNGNIKCIDNTINGKIYNIERFKWVLYIKNNQVTEEVICEHKDDYELTENDKDIIWKEIEKWNTRNDELQTMINGNKKYQEAVDKTKKDKAKESPYIDSVINYDKDRVKVGHINSYVGLREADEIINYNDCDFVDFEYGVNIYDYEATNGQFNAGCFGKDLRDLMVKHGVDTLEFKKDGYVIVEDMNITIGALIIISDEK